MAALETAVQQLHAVLCADPEAPDWRWQVRKGLSAVREALSGSQVRAGDGWLCARAGTSNRDRRRLQARASSLAAVILDRMDAEGAQREVSRLATDLDHYVQRVHDLLYDTVALELGGSE